MTSNDIDFVITRTFKAPRALVFQTMTETEHLQKWWGPQGCTIEVIRHEPRAGGVFHYCMHFGPVAGMYGLFEYREITPIERIVFAAALPTPTASGSATRPAPPGRWKWSIRSAWPKRMAIPS